MYERKQHPPLTRQQFYLRMLSHFAAAMGLLVFSLTVGIAGYCYFEKNLTIVDGFLNSAMLLGGMGPVDQPKTQAGKIFAGVYALYAGLVFIVSAAVILTPVLHRLLHKFHWQDK